MEFVEKIKKRLGKKKVAIWRNRVFKTLIFVLILNLFLKIILILNNSPLIIGPDECELSTIAKDILSGGKISLFDFVFPHKIGGSALAIISLVISYKLLGVSGLSFKLVPLFFSEVLLVIIFLFLNKYFNYRTAILSTIFFIIAPPHFVFRSLLLQGDHFESLIFDWLIISSFFWFLYAKQNKTKKLIIFSLLCGFATFICYASLIVIILCLIFLFILNKKRFVKYISVFTVFFLLGFTPWVVYNVHNDFISLNYWTGQPMFGTVFDKEGDIVSKAYRLFSWGIPHSFHFEDAMLSFNKAIPKIFSIVYSFVILYGFLCLLYFNRRWVVYYLRGLYKKRLDINQKAPEIFILFFLFLFLLAYLFSSFGIDHHGLRDSRYLIPLYPFIFIILGVFVTRLSYSRKKVIKLLACLLLIILVLICTIPLSEMVSFQKMSSVKSLKYFTGCENEEFSFSCTIQAYSNSPNFLKVANRCKKLEGYYPESYVKACYRNLGRGLSRFSPNWKTESYKCDMIQDETYRNECHRGFAYGVGFEHVRPTKIDTLDETCTIVNISYRKYCYQGFGLVLGNAMGWDPLFDLDKCNKVNPAFIHDCVSGAGMGIKSSLLHDPARIISEAEKLKKDYKNTFYESFNNFEYGLKNYTINPP